MDKWLEQSIALAKTAGNAILQYYGKQKQDLAISQKTDRTPLTAADLKAHQVIAAGLKTLTPDLPVLSEEGEIAAYAVRRLWQRYWLVDPLDGTRGFIQGLADFTVNIALIEKGRPMLGVIYVPVSKVCYYASAAFGAFKLTATDALIPLSAAKWQPDSYRVILGRHLSKSGVLSIFQEAPGCRQIHRLNSSLKFCYLAEGNADIYPRFGLTGEWDTAAGQCILEEAGGCVLNLQNEPLMYNAKDSLINPAFVALGDPTAAETIIKFILEKRRNL